MQGVQTFFLLLHVEFSPQVDLSAPVSFSFLGLLVSVFFGLFESFLVFLVDLTVVFRLIFLESFLSFRVDLLVFLRLLTDLPVLEILTVLGSFLIGIAFVVSLERF